ncbi:TPA: restriction endonuclease subunit S, partial [Staphylococcus aureus]|nr:restriction endonuclease subunit S [Staphylococcus aureus]HCX7939660.1 restriction endonuclease subunit S [Staphylococcus aureus]HCX7994500.1 restriction endonuclease subunit S [Staphylococcus aureus]HCX8006090.1 restriction endonuclease subunit S [Staphylococcus aureus]HCX8289582.1 restriction endonuclease subunit S [Staphylococcus aureus]
FPGFEGEWEEKQLGDLTDRVIRKNKNLESKKPLTISGQLGLIDQTEYFSKSVSSKNLENYTLIKNGEFAYNKSYSNGYPLGAIKRLTRYDSGVLSSLYICFSIKSEMSKDFMEAYFDSTHWYREVSGIAVEGARNHGLLNVSVNDFFTILIKYPSLEEQQKIGKFFSKLDRQIELEEQKLELLQQQKKGYMQKIFTQELRFKDENGEEYPEWENKFIKDIFIFENNRRKPITSSLREKGLYPYYGATGIIDYVKDYLFNNEERLLIGEDGAKWGQFETSSFIANGQYWVNNHAHVVKSNDHNLFFMNYYLNFKELRAFVTGNAPAKLTHANLCNINLKIPCLTEQDKVSALLKSIDNKMNNQMNRIELLKERKKGLLQKMFI